MFWRKVIVDLKKYFLIETKIPAFALRMAYGNESGIVIIDIVQKISLIVLNTSDIGGNVDPCQRVLRSPKRQDELKRENEDKARSPSTDQVKCISFLDEIPLLNILIFSPSFSLTLSGETFWKFDIYNDYYCISLFFFFPPTY